MYIVLYRFIPNVYKYVENHQNQQTFDGHSSENPNVCPPQYTLQL